MGESSGEYSEAKFVGHEIIWGEGYMSPGGDEEVASVVDGVEIAGASVLDIGCGLGGPAVALAAKHGAGTVIGVDIQREQIELARALAKRRGVTDRTDFRLVEPGHLPFEEATFDVVFSMGAFVQIPEKERLFGDILRVLRPGGTLAANDWVSEWDGPLSEEMVKHQQGTGLTFNWATSKQTADTLEGTGFVDVVVTDCRQWLTEHFRADIDRISDGPVREHLIQSFDKEAADSWLRGWQRLEFMADRGEIGAIRIRAMKPE